MERSLKILVLSGPNLDRLGTRHHRRGGQHAEQILRQGQDDRAGPALHRHMKRPRDVLGQAVGALHLGGPLGHAQGAWPEDLPVVEFLERLTVALIRSHLPNQQDQRHAVLEGGVHTNGGVGGTRPPGDTTDTWPACQPGVGIGHEGRPTLLPTGDEPDVPAVLVKAVGHREIALAGHTEDGVDTLGDERLDEGMPGRARGI